MSVHSKIKLKISCQNLPSSPKQIVLSIYNKENVLVQRPYRTEPVNSLNPETFIVIDGSFEEWQGFSFMFTYVKPNKHIKPNEPFRISNYLGTLGVENGNMNAVFSHNQSDSAPIIIVIISAEEVLESNRIVKLQFGAHKITKAISTPRAFLTLSSANEDGTFFPVHKTQVISSVNPSWPEFELNNCDLDGAFLLEVKNEKKRDHVLLGQCSVTLRELLETGTKCFLLRLPPELNRNAPKDSVLKVIKVSSNETPTFLDYIRGGAQINLIVAIDFTESNYDQSNPASLHYIGDKDKENDYQQAIRSIGTILEKYDFNKKVAVYGFGGKFRGNPEVLGVDGIMEVYQQTVLNNVELYHPTNFSPIINQTATTIKASINVNKDQYYTLFIITDGVVTDMDTTIRAIARARMLPLSIVIIGVGNADFTSMKILNEQLTMQAGSSTDTSVTDNVQFVVMRDFKAGPCLPHAIMKEIPDRFKYYMKKNNIQPKRSRESNDLQVGELIYTQSHVIESTCPFCHFKIMLSIPPNKEIRQSSEDEMKI